MMELYSIEAYVHQMEPKKSLGNRLESCIVPSVKNWFSLLKTRVMPSNGVSRFFIAKGINYDYFNCFSNW